MYVARVEYHNNDDYINVAFIAYNYIPLLRRNRSLCTEVGVVGISDEECNYLEHVFVVATAICVTLHNIGQFLILLDTGCSNCQVSLSIFFAIWYIFFIINDSSKILGTYSAAILGPIGRYFSTYTSCSLSSFECVGKSRYRR